MYEYLKRQALTIGIQPKEVYKPVWVPNLPEAEGDCLGVIRGSYGKSSFPTITIMPDSKRAITGHNNGHVKMWNLDDGSLLWERKNVHGESVVHLSVSPDSNRIATASYDASLGMAVWEAATGRVISSVNEKFNKITWSPDNRHVVAVSGVSRTPVRVWDTYSGESTYTFPGSGEDIQDVYWYSNGALIAQGHHSGKIDIREAASGTLRKSIKVSSSIYATAVSPDEKYLATGGSQKACLVDLLAGKMLFTLKEKIGGSMYGIAWSPNSKYFATSRWSLDRSGNYINVWEASTGNEVKELKFSDGDCYHLSWSPNGGYIASSHVDDLFRFWDVRDLLPTQITQENEDESPLSYNLHPLPDTLIQLHRLGIYPPLSLVQDLLSLLSGESLSGPLAPIGRALQPLAKLRWPAPARIGLLALILHRVDFRDQWTPPSGISLTELRQGLISALKGTDVEPEPPPPPIAQLTEACTFSDQLITLLHLLGPEAVAKEPGLPLALLHQAGHLPPSTQLDRRLLGLRVRLDGQGGRAIGQGISTGGGDVSGIESGRQRPDWQSLLPTQLALPDDLFHYRLCTGELLYRAREVAEPPQLRPVVLLLDDSPAVYGKVEQVTRLAAFIVGRTLQESGLPVVLVTTGGTVRELHARSDLVEIFTSRTTKRIEAKGSLKVASSLRAYLKGEGPEPVILLLTHPWFGEGEEVDKAKGLRGLFVPVGREVEEPVLAARCERYQVVRGVQDLEFILGELVG